MKKPKQPFLTYLKRFVKIYIFCQEIDKKLPNKWACVALLMEKALILCNPHDKNLKIFAAC